MKKFINIFSIALTIFISLFAFCGCVKSIPDPQITTSEDVKNVILIIGDGMGFNHIKNAKTYFEYENFDFEENYTCSVNTSSKSIGATDSAAAGTAMATGVNVANKKVGMDGNKVLTNIMEIANTKNMKTGIVTTDNLYGATPACFSSHTSNRNNTEDIVKAQSVSNINLLIGQSAKEYTTYSQNFIDNGYTMCSSLEDLTLNSNQTKLIANIPNLKSIYNNEETNQTNFNLIVEYAINYLNNDNGFVLMIECAHIDKFSHNNQIIPALCEVKTLNDVANTALNFAKSRTDTAVIITADHETGGLKEATKKSDISNSLYTKTSHSSNNVPLYTYNCTFNNLKEEVKNTFIFDICKNIVEWC